MYHDQALIPWKALDFDEGVNVTLGLPIVRTSPDHGTAFDIAGKAVADPGAMIAAIRMAGEMAAMRARSEEHTSELQSLMRISYAVFCLKKKKKKQNK